VATRVRGEISKERGGPKRVKRKHPLVWEQGGGGVC